MGFIAENRGERKSILAVIYLVAASDRDRVGKHW